MKLEEFLGKEFVGTPAKGMAGTESDWLDLCAVALPSQEIYIGDPLYTLASLSGLRMRLSKGDYLVQAKLIIYGNDVRVSRARLLKLGAKPSVAAKAGEVWTDIGTLMLCDLHALQQCLQAEPQEITQRAKSALEDWDHYSLARLGEGSLSAVPLIRTGFGDGAFPVHPLKERSDVVGVELVFIEGDTRYPFEGEETTPYPGQDYHWGLIHDIWDPMWAALKQGPEAARKFLNDLSPGRRAVVCIDLFNKDVLLLGGLQQFFRFQGGAEILAPEVLNAYRLLSAAEFAERFEKVSSLCCPVLKAADARAKMQTWHQVAHGPHGEMIDEFERWFNAVMADPGRAIERHIKRYVEAHQSEFL